MSSTHTRELVAFLSIGGKLHPLYSGHNFIGRNKKANVVLRDVSASQQHAVITILNGKIYISDIKSCNATFIENTALIPLHLYEIKDQCALRFGAVKATVTNNGDYSDNHGALIESQCDDAVFGLDTQLQCDETTKRVSTSLLQPISEAWEEENTKSKDKSLKPSVSTKRKSNQGLTQLFWETRKVFQPSNSQLPYSEAIISKSDSDTDAEIITIEPSQDLSGNSNNFLKINSKNRTENAQNTLQSLKNDNIQDKNNKAAVTDIPSDSQSNSASTKILDIERKSIEKPFHFDSDDTDLEDNCELTPKRSKENEEKTINPSPLIRVKRKSSKQVILSDSDSDLDDNDAFDLKIQLRKTTNISVDLKRSAAVSRKSLGNLENIIASVVEENVDNRTVKSLGDNPSSLLIVLKTTKQVVRSDNLGDKIQANREIQHEERRSSDKINLPKEIELENDTDLDEDLKESPNKNSKLSEESKERRIDFDNGTDLDNNMATKEDSPQTIKVKRTSFKQVFNSDSDTDLDDNSNSDKNNRASFKAGSGVKITETNDYNLDNTENSSIEFDFNETNQWGDEKEAGQSYRREESIKNKSNIQNATHDIIVSSDDNDTDLEDISVKKIHKSPLCPLKNANDKNQPNKEVDTINESLDNTQYITAVRNNQVFNNTGTNYDDCSFIPATQDVAEDIEVNTTIATQNLPEKSSQENFSLGLSEYIIHSQGGDKMLKKDSREERADSNVENNEFGGKPELYLATTQQLVCESNDDIRSEALVHQVEDAIFLASTQRCESNHIDNNTIFSKPAPKLTFAEETEQNNGEIEEDNALFLAPTQHMHHDNNDNRNISSDDANDENSIFVKPTQKICVNLQKQFDTFREDTDDTIDNLLFQPPTQKMRVQEKVDDNKQDNPKPSTSKQAAVVTYYRDNTAKCSPKSSNITIPETKTTNVPNTLDVPVQISTPFGQLKDIEIKNTSGDLFDADTQVINVENNKAPKLDEENAISNLFDLPTKILLQSQDKNINDKSDNKKQHGIETTVEKVQTNSRNNDLQLAIEVNKVDVSNQQCEVFLPDVANSNNINLGANKPDESMQDISSEKNAKDNITSSRVTRQKSKQTFVKKSSSKSQKDSTKEKSKNRKIVGKMEATRNEEDNIDHLNETILKLTNGMNVHNPKLDEYENNPMYCTQEVLQVLTSDSPIEDITPSKSLLGPTPNLSTSEDVTIKKGEGNGLQILKDNINEPIASTSKDVEDTHKSTFINPNEAIKLIDKTPSRGRRVRNQTEKVIIEPLYSTQEILNVLTSDSPYKDNEDKIVSIIDKHIDMKPIEKTPLRGRKLNKIEKLNPDKDLQKVKNKPIYSTEEVLDVLASDSPSKYKEDTSTFIKPKHILMSTEKKLCKGKKAKEVKQNIKTSKFSTQEVIDILTSDVAKKIGQAKTMIRASEKDESLNGSAFLKDDTLNETVFGNKKFNKNVQSTMLSDNGEDNQSDEDFEGNKKIHKTPSCSNTEYSIKHKSNLQNPKAPLKLPRKSRKRVIINYCDLDVLHDLPAQNSKFSTVQNTLTKKNKCSAILEDHEQNAVDSDVSPKKIKKIDKTNAESKSRSKEKPIVGILKNTKKETRSSKSIKDCTDTTIVDRITTPNVDHLASNNEFKPSGSDVLTVIKKGRPRKAQINKDDQSKNNNIETIVASTGSNETSIKPMVQAKRGRPKKNVVIKNKDSEDITEAPLTKKVAARRGIASSTNGAVSECIPTTSNYSVDNKKDNKRKRTSMTPLASGSSIPTVTAKRSRTDSTVSDTLTPLSQRSKRQLKPKVVFTMLNAPELESLIRSLGGTVVDSVEACTVLVTASVKRTEKLLTAIGQGKPICSDKWLKECKIQNKFLDPWCHIFCDLEAETKWDFSLEVSLERSQDKKLFENYTMMLMVNTAQDILKKSIESNGGKCVTNARNLPANFVIISVAENQKKFQKYISTDSDVIVVEPEAIFDSVLRQEIRFRMFKLA